MLVEMSIIRTVCACIVCVWVVVASRSQRLEKHVV